MTLIWVVGQARVYVEGDHFVVACPARTALTRSFAFVDQAVSFAIDVVLHPGLLTDPTPPEQTP
jgi:hypothetical protein